ncbi:MAG: DUF2092 domain-containing protein [Xenococcaceae cyanobacterium MO_207.B15]|nr:DUF2092 domain-containing protein [Xenococcaceae cyanobacterium MO_207.B15]
MSKLNIDFMLLNTRIFATLLVACTMPFVTASKVLPQTAPSSTRLPSTGLRTTDQVLDQVCNFLKAQKSFTVEMDITYDNVLDSGEKVQYAAYQKVWVSKPNQLRSDYRGDQRNNSFYYDGKFLTWQNTYLDFYATKPAASTIDQVVKNVELKYGLTIPLSNLFVDDPCAKVTSDIQKSVFVGSNLVDRVPAYHILFIGEDRDWQMWVSRARQPLPLKIVITYKNLPSSPQYTAILSKWNFTPEIPAKTFTYEPSEEAIGIEFLPAENISDAVEK